VHDHRVLGSLGGKILPPAVGAGLSVFVVTYSVSYSVVYLNLNLSIISIASYISNLASIDAIFIITSLIFAPTIETIPLIVLLFIMEKAVSTSPILKIVVAVMAGFAFGYVVHGHNFGAMGRAVGFGAIAGICQFFVPTRGLKVAYWKGALIHMYWNLFSLLTVCSAKLLLASI